MQTIQYDAIYEHPKLYKWHQITTMQFININNIAIHRYAITIKTLVNAPLCSI